MTQIEVPTAPQGDADGAGVRTILNAGAFILVVITVALYFSHQVGLGDAITIMLNYALLYVTVTAPR
jgi:hypothetical protein